MVHHKIIILLFAYKDYCSLFHTNHSPFKLKNSPYSMRVRFSFSSRRTRKIDSHNKHRQDYPSLAKEVIISSDIVLEILDARFIKETRNYAMEAFASEHGKVLIYVINKAD